MPDSHLIQVATTHANGWDLLRDLMPVASTLLMGLVALLLERLRRGQTAATTAAGNAAVAAGSAASSAQDSAASAKDLVATVAVSAGKHTEQLNAMQAEGHKTHILVNSQKTALEVQNKGLRALMAANGIPVPDDLIAPDSQPLVVTQAAPVAPAPP